MIETGTSAHPPPRTTAPATPTPTAFFWMAVHSSGTFFAVGVTAGAGSLVWGAGPVGTAAAGGGGVTGGSWVTAAGIGGVGSGPRPTPVRGLGGLPGGLVLG